MASPTMEEFEELRSQVDRLNRLAAAQAAYFAAVMSFGVQASREEPDARLYTIAEAITQLGVSRTTFLLARRELALEPAEKLGKSPRFTADQIETIRRQIYGG